MDKEEAKAELKKQGVTLQAFAGGLGISRQGLNKRWVKGVPRADRFLILGIPEGLQEMFEHCAAQNPEHVRLLLTSTSDPIIKARLEQLEAKPEQGED